MKEFWNERYAAAEFIYGEAPNEFLKECLANISGKSILFPAEGEGRNAVYAASLGWKVEAFDYSEAANKKAMALAQKNGVTINYQVGELPNLSFDQGRFDAIALIYAHFAENLLAAYHQKLLGLLHPGGYLIVEAFGKKQIEYQEKYNSGGPKNIHMLFDEQLIQRDFASLEPLLLEEREVTLHEGAYHHGPAYVLRYMGKAKPAASV